MIKVLSLDLWVTLISGNPAFKTKRAEFLAEFTAVPFENIEGFFKKADDMWTEYEEVYQTSVPAHIRFATVFTDLKIDMRRYSYEMLQVEIEAMFILYPPIVHPSAFAFLRDHLASRDLIISTNTGFMRGEVLRKALKVIGIEFDNIVASDEIGYCKPHPNFFEKVKDCTRCDDKEIIHIGDNPVTDVLGARLQGMHTFLIDHNDEKLSFKVLAEHLKNIK